MSPDIVISGTGLVTAAGRGVDPFWRAFLDGRSLLRPAREFAAPPYAGEPVGEVGRHGFAVPRKTSYLHAAVVEALAMARLPWLPDGALVILVGQALADGSEEGTDAAEFLGPRYAAAKNPVHLSHACASAAFAVGLARAALRDGAAPCALVAGSSVLNRYEYASMTVVRAVSKDAARPFDAERSGISLGEGAGAVIMEPASAARARGVPADLVVAGAACRVAAERPASSDPEVIGACVRAALADADVPCLDALHHVHAHATGTPQGDGAELRALEALGRPGLPVTSHKGAIGHLLHASAFPALAATALALRQGVVPPVPGLRSPEETSLLLPTSPVRREGPRTALVNAFGFGGNNAAIVLRLAA